MAESIQKKLSSKFADRLVDNQISNCEYYLPMIEVPQQHYLYLSVIHAMIPYSFYNISNTNNCITFQLLSLSQRAMSFQQIQFIYRRVITTLFN